MGLQTSSDLEWSRPRRTVERPPSQARNTVGRFVKVVLPRVNVEMAMRMHDEIGCQRVTDHGGCTSHPSIHPSIHQSSCATM